MLVAKDTTGERVTSRELAKEEYRDGTFLCPYCGREAIWVKRSVNGRVAHFRHQEEPDHEPIGESQEHEALKLALHETYQNRSDIYTASLEAELSNNDDTRYADLLVVTKDDESVAIEVQLSYQGVESFKDRTKHYEDMGIATLWVVGERGFMDEKTINGTEGYSYKEPIKWLQKQYFGRVYFIQDLDIGFEIKPFKFSAATKSRGPAVYECSDCFAMSNTRGACSNCGGDLVVSHHRSTVSYKSLANLTNGAKITNYSLLVPDRTGEMPYREYKIARFYDSKWW